MNVIAVYVMTKEKLSRGVAEKTACRKPPSRLPVTTATAKW